MSNQEMIDVIEIRKARNGYVLCAFLAPFGTRRDQYMAAGFATYVVESDKPADVARAVERALKDYPISMETLIPPARQLP